MHVDLRNSIGFAHAAYLHCTVLNGGTLYRVLVSLQKCNANVQKSFLVDGA